MRNKAIKIKSNKKKIKERENETIVDIKHQVFIISSFNIALIWICRLNIMAKGTFILSAHIPKTEEQKDRVKVRKTGARYIISY